MTIRDATRILNLFMGFLNLYYWHTDGWLFNFVIACLNIGVFVFGKK